MKGERHHFLPLINCLRTEALSMGTPFLCKMSEHFETTIGKAKLFIITTKPHQLLSIKNYLITYWKQAYLPLVTTSLSYPSKEALDIFPPDTSDQ